MLRVSHTSIGVEVRRRPYVIEVDGRPVGSVEMNAGFETLVEPGTHTVRVREGRKSSRNRTFTIAEGGTVSYRATGKRFVAPFLLSFAFPGLGLVLVRQ